MLSFTKNAGSHRAIEVAEGDVIEFGRPNQRYTAEVMLLTDDNEAVLDLFDGRPPVIVAIDDLPAVSVFRPDMDDTLLAA